MVGTRSSSVEWLAEVIVMPKEGVNDPEGEAILGGLRSLGHDGVQSVRAGRVLRLEVTALDEDGATVAVGRMCDQLLANPVIESYQINVTPVSTAVETR